MSTYAPHLHWQIYLAVNEWGGSSRDIALSRDPASMIGEPMAKQPLSSLQSEALNALWVMDRDLDRVMSARWEGWGRPELHKFLREQGKLLNPEYTGDYEGLVNA